MSRSYGSSMLVAALLAGGVMRVAEAKPKEQEDSEIHGTRPEMMIVDDVEPLPESRQQRRARERAAAKSRRKGGIRE